MVARKRLPKSEPQNCQLFQILSRFERVFTHKQRHMQPLTRHLFLPKLLHVCFKLAGTCACTVEAQSCGPWKQRLSNYQNKSCKSYAFSFNYLKGKCANLNHSNIDSGDQGAKTSKSVIRRGDISPPKASSSTHVRNTATAAANVFAGLEWLSPNLAQVQPSKNIGKNGLAQNWALSSPSLSQLKLWKKWLSPNLAQVQPSKNMGKNGLAQNWALSSPSLAQLKHW